MPLESLLAKIESSVKKGPEWESELENAADPRHIWIIEKVLSEVRQAQQLIDMYKLHIGDDILLQTSHIKRVIQEGEGELSCTLENVEEKCTNLRKSIKKEFYNQWHLIRRSKRPEEAESHRSRMEEDTEYYLKLTSLDVMPFESVSIGKIERYLDNSPKRDDLAKTLEKHENVLKNYPSPKKRRLISRKLWLMRWQSRRLNYREKTLRINQVFDNLSVCRASEEGIKRTYKDILQRRKSFSDYLSLSLGNDESKILKDAIAIRGILNSIELDHPANYYILLGLIAKNESLKSEVYEKAEQDTDKLCVLTDNMLGRETAMLPGKEDKLEDAIARYEERRREFINQFNPLIQTLSKITDLTAEKKIYGDYLFRINSKLSSLYDINGIKSDIKKSMESLEEAIERSDFSAMANLSANPERYVDGADGYLAGTIQDYKNLVQQTSKALEIHEKKCDKKIEEMKIGFGIAGENKLAIQADFPRKRLKLSKMPLPFIMAWYLEDLGPPKDARLLYVKSALRNVLDPDKRSSLSRAANEIEKLSKEDSVDPEWVSKLREGVSIGARKGYYPAGCEQALNCFYQAADRYVARQPVLT